MNSSCQYSLVGIFATWNNDIGNSVFLLENADDDDDDNTAVK